MNSREWLDGRIKLYQGDCMEVMEEFEDGSFDLVLTDPPYGINISNGKIGSDGKAKTTNWEKKDWDNEIPKKEVFESLFKKSDNQIIFGGNYFSHILPQSKRWIVWDKQVPEKMTFSGVELAYTSFNKNSLDFIRYTWHGMLQENMKDKDIRIHPTQKPAGLFNKILLDYSNENDIILDPFAGSATTLISCIRTNRRCVGIELDETYFELACKRIDDELRQTDMFLNN